MPEIDKAKLIAVLQRLLQSQERPGLHPDGEGWFEISEVAAAVTVRLSVEVGPDHVLRVGRQLQRFEVHSGRIRVLRRHRAPLVPDILFHATTQAQVDEVVRHGVLKPLPGRRLLLSGSEDQAWRAAHRLDGAPRLMVVDAIRSRRSGVRFGRGRSQGVFESTPIPARHILNLREGYAEQWSAGGIPVRRDDDGVIRMALIRVTRRSGSTWEVAKGKLEPGESPEDTAVREVQEEMGVSTDFRLLRHVGDVRYGFLAPGGGPRLKTIFLYLMTPDGEMEHFVPAEAEGIGAVRWFTPAEACAAVTHTSLQPLMFRARDQVARYGLTPAASLRDPDPAD